MSLITHKKLIALLGCVGIVVTAASFKVGVGRPSRDSAPSRTVVLIRIISRGLVEYQESYGKLPFVGSPVVMEQNNTLLVEVLNKTNGPIANRLNPKAIEFSSSGLLEGNEKLLDPWHHPLHILFSTNSLGVTVAGKSIPFDFAIWSDGRNGKNENGEGDDIASWKTR